MKSLDDLWKDATTSDMDIIAEAAFKELKTLDLHDFKSYAKSHHEIILTLYKCGKIPPVAIDELLHDMIVRRGRRDYELMKMYRGCAGLYSGYAEHLLMPEALAYCISRNVFSENELYGIPLEPGNTPKKFAEKYGKKNMLSTMREEYIYPDPSLKPDPNRPQIYTKEEFHSMKK